MSQRLTRAGLSKIIKRSCEQLDKRARKRLIQDYRGTTETESLSEIVQWLLAQGHSKDCWIIVCADRQRDQWIVDRYGGKCPLIFISSKCDWWRDLLSPDNKSPENVEYAYVKIEALMDLDINFMSNST